VSVDLVDSVDSVERLAAPSCSPVCVPSVTTTTDNSHTLPYTPQHYVAALPLYGSGRACYHASGREGRALARGDSGATIPGTTPGQGERAQMGQGEDGAFGLLLRRHRVVAGLSQEQLAERSGLTAQGISALERGLRRAPYPDTVRRLATALGLSDADHAAFHAAVACGRRPVPSAAPSRDAAPARPDAPPALAYHLPAQPTALIGRAREVADGVALLRGGDLRLLTLTGPGGVGKTRLALQVAAEAGGLFDDGVVFVALAALRDHDLVAATIAGALGAPDVGGRSLAESVRAYLGDKRLLLLLDNFEHVAAAAPLVADLLAACPGVVVLATSRAALRVRGERVYPVPPLATPDPTRLPPPAALATIPAVDLLMRRARDLAPDLTLDAASAPAIAALCHHLDGLPLALELAAVRLRVLSPQALLARLGRRLPVLTGGARDLPERQRTLRATLDWSYDLLTAGERALFRRMAVFAGGCALAAIEAVCVDGTDGVDAGIGALDALGALVDKSLVQRDGDPGEEPRFTMLETVREFGLDLLAASGEAERTYQRHAAHYAALAETAEPEVVGPRQAAWLGRLDRDAANMRAALGWALAGGDGALGVRMAGALGRYWERRGHLSEGRQWLERALDGREGPPDARAKALNAAGWLAYRQSAHDHAVALAEESIALYRAVGDADGVAQALNTLGAALLRRGEAPPPPARPPPRPRGDRAGVAASVTNLGLVAEYEGDFARAAALYADGLALYRQLGDTRYVAWALYNVASASRQQGDAALAMARGREALALFRDLADTFGMALALQVLGDVACDEGRYARATALHRESVDLYETLGNRLGIAEGLESLGRVAMARQQPERAGRLYGAAAALRAVIDAPMSPVERAAYERTMAALRAALSPGALAAVWAEGGALSPAHALMEVRETEA